MADNNFDNYNKISPTAVFCARMRAKQDIPFAKDVVNLIDTSYSKFVEDLPDYGNTLNSKSDNIPFIEGRYCSLNFELVNIKNAFIVEIASGLSTRSLDLVTNENIIYVETELNDLIRIKENIVKDISERHNLKEHNIIFMPVNPLIIEDMDKIGELYLELGKGKKLIILHEGLLMYFNKDEKKVFRDNLKYLFKKYSKEGIWLTSDFSRIKNVSDRIKGPENIRDKISKVTNREFDYFSSEEETCNFLKEAGFNSVVKSNYEPINVLIEKKGLLNNKNAILETAKGYRVWMIFLK